MRWAAAQVAKGSEAAKQIFSFTIIADTNWYLIIGCFVFYFIGGYLFYASLFAAVGSVVNEDPQEAQSLLLPISMPIIFSFIIMSIAIQDPGGPLAVWASHDSFQFTHRDDGPDSIWRAHYSSLLAAIIKHGSAGRRIFIYYLDGRKNLPYRNPALW